MVVLGGREVPYERGTPVDPTRVAQTVSYKTRSVYEMSLVYKASNDRRGLDQTFWGYGVGCRGWGYVYQVPLGRFKRFRIHGAGSRILRPGVYLRFWVYGLRLSEVLRIRG